MGQVQSDEIHRQARESYGKVAELNGRFWVNSTQKH